MAVMAGREWWNGVEVNDEAIILGTFRGLTSNKQWCTYS